MPDSALRLALLAVAIAATLSAALDWVSYSSGSLGFGLLSRGTSWSDSLAWEGMRPPLILRLLVLAAAWALVVLSRRHPSLAARLALPTAVVLTVPILIGSPLPPFSLHRDITPAVTLGPATGMWLGLVSLLFAGAATAAAMTRRPRG